MEQKKITPKNNQKKLNDKQILYIIIAVVVFIVVAYAARGIYYSYTGSVRSEVINYVTENQNINVEGIVIRDEGSSNQSGSSLLKKASGGTYAPIVSDGESVAKGQSIAYIFQNEETATKFREREEINERLNLLTQLQDSENIGYLDLSMLNSEIAASVSNLIALTENNDLSKLDSKISNLCYKITSKQIVTGEDVDFKAEIKELNKRLDKLEKSAASKKDVVSPKAGYFVSKVDGLEDICDYKKVAQDGLTYDKIKKLKKVQPKNTDNYFGKIISEHAWYFAFNISFKEASALKVNKSVKVSFPDKNVSDVDMIVTSIKRKGDNAAVVLRCLSMNDNLLYLRSEKAVITIASYYGLKINNSALTKITNTVEKKYSKEVTMGVFANVGNIALFKPINIVYKTDEYVIALPVTKYYELKDEFKQNNDASFSSSESITEVTSSSSASDETSETQNDPRYEEKEIDKKNVLKAYDRIIVKGRNLYDGKVIG